MQKIGHGDHFFKYCFYLSLIKKNLIGLIFLQSFLNNFSPFGFRNSQGRVSGHA